LTALVTVTIDTVTIDTVALAVTLSLV